MVTVCFYFHVHQPFRIRHYPIYDIGINHDYFDEKKNKEIMRKIATKCYLPMNNLLLELINQYGDKFKVSFSISGVVIEQMEKYAPEVLESFKKLVKTGKVELVSETYYHSLAFLYSLDEFKRQVKMQEQNLKKHFGVKPKIFRNTELVYRNDIAKFVEDLGYDGILAEGWDYVLGWRSPNFVYEPIGTKKIALMLKNYKLSDDIAFRFSNRGWNQWPLTVEKYNAWINNINGNGEVVNLFMDYETFGEHQWAETGIFEFMRYLPGAILSNPDNNFLTISEAIKKYPKRDKIDIPFILSWADMERDLSAWNGNRMQQDSLYHLYKLEKEVLASKDEKLIDDWRKLTTSDHSYYMSTKYFNDGDIHKYFNAYDTPYDAFINFMNVLSDIEHRLRNLKDKKKDVKKQKISKIKK